MAWQPQVCFSTVVIASFCHFLNIQFGYSELASRYKIHVDTQKDLEVTLGENVSVAKCSPIFTVYNDSTAPLLLMLHRLTWMQTDAIFGTLKALPVHPHRLPPLCRGSYTVHSPAGRRQTSLCLSQRCSPFPTCPCFCLGKGRCEVRKFN